MADEPGLGSAHLKPVQDCQRRGCPPCLKRWLLMDSVYYKPPLKAIWRIWLPGSRLALTNYLFLMSFRFAP